MIYCIDTEFLEGPQKESFPISLFRKQTPNTIDLISIGIVAEDGREFYAISKDFNLKEAWNRFDLEMQSGDMRNVFPEGRKIYWLRENVLKPIWRELFINYELTNDIYSNKASDILVKNVELGSYDNYFSFKSLKSLLELYGKTNKEIASEIKAFVYQDSMNSVSGNSSLGKNDYTPTNINEIEFYAYYADYDWVVFCWLFGKMIDLPKGFPMYCRDLKQMLDDKSISLLDTDIMKFSFELQDFKAVKSGNYLDYISAIKNHKDYPKQDPSKSHNAIEDARWNKQLFDFLLKL